MSQELLHEKIVIQNYFFTNFGETFLIEKFGGISKLENSKGEPVKMVLVNWKEYEIPFSYIGPTLSEQILSNCEEEVTIVGFSNEVVNLDRKDKVMMRVNKFNKITNKTRQVEMKYSEVQRLYIKELLDFYASKMEIYNEDAPDHKPKQ